VQAVPPEGEPVSVASERARRHRAGQIAALGKTNPFQALREEVKEEAERVRARLHGRLLDTGIMASDLQRQADYDRGYVDGMNYATVSVITRAERALEREQPPEEEPQKDRWAHGQ